MAKVALFSSFNEVEVWARTHGVRRLREMIPNLAETSAYLASAWLKRFDSCVRIALEQQIVRAGPGDADPKAGGRVIQGPWRVRGTPVRYGRRATDVRRSAGAADTVTRVD
jgi:hypothetical protein